METKAHNNFYMEFIEEDEKTYVLFYDSEENLVAKREITHQDISETIRLSGEYN